MCIVLCYSFVSFCVVLVLMCCVLLRISCYGVWVYIDTDVLCCVLVVVLACCPEALCWRRLCILLGVHWKCYCIVLCVVRLVSWQECGLSVVVCTHVLMLTLKCLLWSHLHLYVGGGCVPSVPCMQDQSPSQPPPASASNQTVAGAAFEVERPSVQELLERPIQSNGKLIISSEQLKQLAVLLDNPVSMCPAHM